MKVYPENSHPDGYGNSPWFTVQGDKLYPDYGHPEGYGNSAWYRMR